MTRTFMGSCHCGAVRCEVDLAPPEKAYACNCSICSRTGWLLAFSDASGFRLVAGERSLSDYQFGKKSTHHAFCTNCGVRSFSRGKGRDGKESVAVNLRCIEGMDATKLPVEAFDGASL